MATPADREVAARAVDDIDYFARALVGEALWPHQLEIARADARIRLVCSGRQAGKSRTLALLALWEAFRRAEFRVLILSAGEDAAKGLLAEISAMLSGSPLLAGAVVDDTKSSILLSNGSTIRSVPASTKQVRGRSIDLLILDEACFIDEDVWTAAKYTVIARPGSRVVMASTPWGRKDRFFALAFRAGERRVEGYASFRWPSTVSPMVDEELLEMWRTTSTLREYRAEVLAEWVDAQGAYFTPEELEAAMADYELVDPLSAEGLVVSGGVDWGFAHDANTLVTLGALPDVEQLCVPFLEERFDLSYSAFIDRVVELGSAPAGMRFGRLVSETNGVGAMPSQELSARLGATGVGWPVVPVHTTAKLKEDAFGAVKMLLQQGRLALPRHPELLSQLSALEFEAMDSGLLRIAVPERAGHDDLAMGLALAASGELLGSEVETKIVGPEFFGFDEDDLTVRISPV